MGPSLGLAASTASPKVVNYRDYLLQLNWGIFKIPPNGEYAGYEVSKVLVLQSMQLEPG